METLPLDVLLSVLDELDLAAKTCFALCNKWYFNLLKSQEIFRRLHLEQSQLCSFLQMLERDLPVENLFCPTCLKFHRIAVLPVNHRALPQAELDIRSHTSKGLVRSAERLYESWWPCMKDDSKNEISLFYGDELNFCQARMALKLQRYSHDYAQEFLESLNLLKLQTKNGSAFFRREMRVIWEEGQLPQLFMRFQRWWIIDKRDLNEHHSLISEGGQVPLICFHRADPYVDFDGSRAKLAVQAWRIIEALESAIDEDEKMGRGNFNSKASSRRKLAQNAGFYAIIHPNYVDHNDPVATVSPDHEHSYLDHCFKCSTDLRLDAIRFAEGSHSARSLFNHKRDYAIVLTKWMNLGTLADQNSKEWKGHAYAETKKFLVPTSKFLRNGEVMRVFEGRAEYRPEWSGELEVAWKEAVECLGRPPVS